jgi:hypothetical protein
MKIINVHQRLLQARPEHAGALINTLASAQDKLWPRMHWPRMVLDAPLGVGAAGGHGPIRYVVDAFEPGQRVRFRFTAPRGFDGWHALEVLDATSVHCVLEHRIEMNITGAGAADLAAGVPPAARRAGGRRAGQRAAFAGPGAPCATVVWLRALSSRADALVDDPARHQHNQRQQDAPCPLTFWPWAAKR